MEIRAFLTADDRSPFADWFDDLAPQSAAKVTVALARMERGNLSNAKSVGGGVQEYRIDWGPGYRLYFGWDGDTVIILLCGGTKRRQQNDIAEAKMHWAEYQRRKKQEG